jgi:hypothetical protein
VDRVVDSAGLRDWEHVVAYGFPVEDLQGRALDYRAEV